MGDREVTGIGDAIDRIRYRKAQSEAIRDLRSSNSAAVQREDLGITRID